MPAADTVRQQDRNIIASVDWSTVVVAATVNGVPDVELSQAIRRECTTIAKMRNQ